MNKNMVKFICAHIVTIISGGMIGYIFGLLGVISIYLMFVSMHASEHYLKIMTEENERS